jgi:hypothetical protein
VDDCRLGKFLYRYTETTVLYTKIWLTAGRPSQMHLFKATLAIWKLWFKSENNNKSKRIKVQNISTKAYELFPCSHKVGENVNEMHSTHRIIDK